MDRRRHARRRRKFRRIKGYNDMPLLLAALARHIATEPAETVRATA